MRFTIRDLLWLTVVVALVAGWWTDRTRLAELEHWKQRAELLKGVVEAEGEIVGWDGGAVTFTPKNQPRNPSAPAPNPPND